MRVKNARASRALRRALDSGQYWLASLCWQNLGKNVWPPLTRSWIRYCHPPLTCEVCEKSFNTLSSLERHGYLHKELKYKCEKCGARFPFVSSMESHMVTHLKDPLHKCNFSNCDKVFFNKGNLVKHAKMHTNKKFKCSLCEYENVDDRNLKGHMCKHSNLKRYLCSMCLKLFKYHVQLARHLPCKSKKPSENSTSGSRSPEY